MKRKMKRKRRKMQKLRTNRTLRLSKNLSSMTVTVRMLQKVSYTTQCVSYTSIFLNSIQIVAVVIYQWVVPVALEKGEILASVALKYWWREKQWHCNDRLVKIFLSIWIASRSAETCVGLILNLFWTQILNSTTVSFMSWLTLVLSPQDTGLAQRLEIPVLTDRSLNIVTIIIAIDNCNCIE